MNTLRATVVANLGSEFGSSAESRVNSCQINYFFFFFLTPIHSLLRVAPDIKANKSIHSQGNNSSLRPYFPLLICIFVQLDVHVCTLEYQNNEPVLPRFSRLYFTAIFVVALMYNSVLLSHLCDRLSTVFLASLNMRPFVAAFQPM